MHFLITIKNNWRDLLAFFAIGLGLAIVGAFIDYIGNRWFADSSLHAALPVIANYFQGFSKFIGASITATLLWMLLWPRVSKDAHESFDATFAAMQPVDRMKVYLVLIIGALIAASHCFA